MNISSNINIRFLHLSLKTTTGNRKHNPIGTCICEEVHGLVSVNQVKLNEHY